MVRAQDIQSLRSWLGEKPSIYMNSFDGVEPTPTATNLRGLAHDLLDEVATLRAMLARYRDEVPLGHQPHMLAHLVDEALGRA